MDDIDYDELIDGPDVNETADYESVDIEEHMLLSYLTSNPYLWTKVTPILKKEYFDPEHQPVVKFLTEFQKKYKKLPSKRIIHAQTGIVLDTPEDADDPKIVDFICDKTEEFCRYNAMRQFLVKSADQIKDDASRDTVFRLYREAGDITRISLHRDLGFEVHESTRSVLEHAKDDIKNPTGMTHYDILLDGGVARPSVNLVSASSGQGKSVWLMNMAAKAAKRGEHVVYYTLELSAEQCQQRFAAILSGTDIKAVFSRLDRIDFELQSRRRKNTTGCIWVKRFPMKGTTIADIEAHYAELQEMSGLNWTFVCIDYMDVMSSVEKIHVENIHMKDKMLIQEINDFTHNNHLIMWTASQQTKGAIDEEAPRSGSLAGGNDKLNGADNLLTLKATEQEYQEGMTFGYIQKARSARAFGKKFPILWDANTLIMSDAPDELFLKTNKSYENKLTGENKPDRDMNVTFDDIKKQTNSERKAAKTFNKLTKKFGDRV